MDDRKRIIDYIEQQYQYYLNRQSDVLFNAATDELFDLITAIPICKDIISKIKKEYPVNQELLINNQNIEYFTYVDNITSKPSYYISYCLHWFDYIKNKGVHSPEGYDQKCDWLHSNMRGPKDSMLLFKTDFVRPILNYIINQLDEEVYLLYLLERFKQRAERFGINIHDKTTNELTLQKDLFLYLFDEGLELWHSADIGNGEIDFAINITGQPFIIEVKLYKKESNTNGYISQLKDYMEKTSANWGCLYIFTTEDVSFELGTASDFIFVKTIYIGHKKPSQRKTKIRII